MFVTENLPLLLDKLLSSIFAIMGYVSVIGSYLLQPISRLGEIFVGSYTSFNGVQTSVIIQPIPLLESIGNIISHFAGDTPILVFLCAILLTFGLVANCVRNALGS